MPVSIHRRRLETFAAAVERHHVVPRLYIASLCLVYLMWNIWLARAVYVFAVMPLALCLVRRSDLKPILASPLFSLAALYFGLLSLAALAAPDASALPIAKHVMYALQVLSFLAITALLIRRDRDFPKWLFLFLSSAAAIAAAINLVAFCVKYPHALLSQQLAGVQGISMYYNTNVLGDVYAMACAGGFALLAGQRLSRPQLIVALSATLMLLLAIGLVMSRGAIMATMAAALVALLLSGGWRRRLPILAALAATLLLLALATPIPHLLLSRGDAFRLSLWPVYLDLAAQRPWLGYGLSFDTHVALPNGYLILNAHNIVLSALIRGGLLSAAALVAMLAAAVYRAWRSWFAEQNLFAPVLLAAAIAATSVDYEILATPLGWPWLLLWLPVGLSFATAAGGRGQMGR